MSTSQAAATTVFTPKEMTAAIRELGQAVADIHSFLAGPYPPPPHHVAPCWPNLSDRINKLFGLSPTDSATAVVDDGNLGSSSYGRLISPLLFPSSERPAPEQRTGCLSSPSVVTFTETEKTDGDVDPAAAASVPCLAFGSEDGYKVFALAEEHVRDGDVVKMRLSRGRRHVSSPHGGMVFATNMCGRYPCRLVDPFTGEETSLPDMPVPFSEEEPMLALRDEPRYRVSTDDGFAWDWSPRGVVMAARGDTAFFCKTTGGGGEWTPVHRSSHGSPMSDNIDGSIYWVAEEADRIILFDLEDKRVTSVKPLPTAATRATESKYNRFRFRLTEVRGRRGMTVFSPVGRISTCRAKPWPPPSNLRAGGLLQECYKASPPWGFLGLQPWPPPSSSRTSWSSKGEEML